MPRETRILVADADASVREVVRLAAREAGWLCDDAPDGITALKQLRRRDYELVVASVELPELDGLVVCRHVRKTNLIPVILISKNGKEMDRLTGFAAGGNDYLVKPFYPRELIARAKNLMELCDCAPSVTSTFIAGHIRIEDDSHSVFVDGKRTALSPKEYDLLLFFVKNPLQVFSRDKLLDLVWGPEFDGTDRTVDTHVKSLRAKIKPFQSCIETVWGLGYKFSP